MPSWFKKILENIVIRDISNIIKAMHKKANLDPKLLVSVLDPSDFFSPISENI